MNIEKLPSGSYRVRKTYQGHTYTKVFSEKPTEKEITLAFAEQFKILDNIKGTFEEKAKQYIESRNNIVSPATVRTYNIKLNQISDEFKRKKINSITANDVQVEINLFSVNHAPKTTRTLHGFIASVLGSYRPDLALRTTLPVLKESTEYEPNSDEIKRLLKHVKNSRYSVPFQLGVLGLRRGEICALELSDLSGNELHIHRDIVYDGKWIVKDVPKTEASNRTIAIPDSLAEEIRTQGFVYEGHPNALNKAIHRFQKELSMQEFKFHCLRSYFASYAHTLGIPDKDIQYLGGWKTDAVMKNIYRKSMKESVDVSAQKIIQNIF